MSLIAVQVLARGMGLVFVAVATRSLAPADFGAYSIAAGLFTVGTVIGDFGTSRLIAREVSRGGVPEEVIDRALIPSLCLGTLSAAAVVGFALVAYDGAPLAATCVAAAGLPGMTVLTSYFGALDGVGRMPLRAWLTFGMHTVTALGGLAALLLWADGLAAAAALSLSGWLTLLPTIVIARRHGVTASWPLSMNRSAMRSFVTAAAPFAGLSAISIVSRRFDLIALSVLRTPADVAGYDLAVRACEAASFAATALSSASLYALARSLGSGNHEEARIRNERLARVAAMFGLLVSAMVVGGANQIIDVVASDEYDFAAPLLRILGLQIWLEFLAAHNGAVLAAGPDLRGAMRIGVALIAAIIVGNSVFIPILGSAGAAWVTVAVNIMNVALYRRRNAEHVGLRLPLPHPAMLASAALGGSVVYFLEDRIGLGALIVGAAVVFAGFMSAGGQEDVARGVRLLRAQSLGEHTDGPPG